ncbi:succinylglutamate desuccinylase [Burkholderia gladioli]|uniref:succinylglutamate desuccinylase n=1 Tax=Burkholderia gladioli TaxID=28095 RepID=UPI0019075770|nr:succinylglutamate desuccinylase [Burkholderia gladioli]MBJ9714028.1 succinylglutamate desuccinylase [Burkholderia gladioli]
MTSSADRGGASAWLDDFLAFTLAGGTPDAREGVCAGGAVRYAWRGEGLLELGPAASAAGAAASASLLVSAGVHGDETAPIELLSMMVRDLARGALPLANRLLVGLGHPAAMRAGTRYLDDDLNRLFNGRPAQREGSRDAPRAAVLEAAAREFFATAPESRQARWHLDMHTAIRASAFEQFALLPHIGEPPARAMIDWLARARIAAVLLHTEAGNTYSQFCASACGALACTLELGKVRPFGQNELSRFAGADAAVRALVAGEVGGAVADAAAAAAAPLAPLLPRVFTVIGQLTKQSEAFELLVAGDVANFTPLARGTLVARDGDYRYLVSHDEERIVFPNPAVKPGLRAGLMVVETTEATLAALG